MELSLQTYEDCEAETREYGTKRERPVDLVHLARQTLGDKDLECEVLELFRRQSISNVSKMKDAANDDAWRNAAHTLKGSARGIGAWPVADLAEQVERLAGAELEKGRTESIEALERLVGVTNDYIVSLLSDK